MTEQTFKYVPHSQTKEYEALGWEFSANLGPPHGCYSVLYVWAGEGEPVMPKDQPVKQENDNG